VKLVLQDVVKTEKVLYVSAMVDFLISRIWAPEMARNIRRLAGNGQAFLS